MPHRIARHHYADIYGPTTGDTVRLGDTGLVARVESDATHYGDECKFGGGKVLRDAQGQAAGIPDADALDVPYLFLSANQDNSVPAASVLIENDWEAVPGPAWIVDVEGAGHWSFTDIAGLGGNYTPGCAELDDRVDYIDTAVGREIAADVAAAFFGLTLLGDADGEGFLETAFWVGPAFVRSRP